VLNVKGVGYIIKHKITVENIPVLPNEMLTLNFEDIFVKEFRVRKVSLFNSGKFNFDFAWKRKNCKYVIITPEQGTVKQNESFDIEIKYAP